MKRWLATGVAMLVVLGGVHAAASSNAQTVAAGNLASGPFSDASSVAPVASGAAVTVIERKGGWYHVRIASGQDGWLPMASIRYDSSGAAAAGGGGSDWAALLQSGRSGSGGSTATTGVRGLNTGDIENAVPDPDAVTELEDWAAKPGQAKRFAEQLPAAAQKVDYLDDRGR